MAWAAQAAGMNDPDGDGVSETSKVPTHRGFVACALDDRGGYMDQTLDFQALVWAAGDAIIASGMDGAILLWNPAAERIFGFTAEEALGRSLDLIIPERLRNRHWEGYERVMRTGKTRYGVEVLRVPALHKEGRSLSIAFTVGLLCSQDGRVQAITAIVRDETSRWQAERALRLRLTELEAQSK